MTEREAGRRNLPVKKSWFGAGFQVILVAWAAVLVLYFEVREGLVRWPWLFEPAAGGIFRENGLPAPRFVRPPSADAPVAPYIQILKNALGPYNIQWGNAPWKELLIAAAMIGAFTLLGWMILSVFRVFMPLGARLCVALTVGCGAAGVGGELLALAGGLNRTGVVALWAALLLGAGAGWLVRFRHRHSLEDFSAHSRLTTAEQNSTARHWYALIYPWPASMGGRGLAWIYVVLFGLITGLVTLHAVGEPVTYWDSLILYVGYARSIFLTGGFPEKVVGQVGMGLGANYPHLFEVLAAQTAALAGYWSDTFAQLLPPVATAAAMVLVYYAMLELSRERLVALAAALLVRSVPYGLSYSQFASNYSLAILFTAAFIYMAIKLVQDGLPAYRWLMLLLAAGAVHINYLMWGLWPVAVVAMVMSCGRPRGEASAARMDDFEFDYDDDRGRVLSEPEHIVVTDRPSVWQLLRSRDLWVSLAVALVIASPWYVRNVVVTGNPVYAFYSNVFPSKNVNPAVMKSAEQEWLLNGDGLGRVGRSVSEKLANSWLYFVTGDQHWKLSPVFMAFVVPGFVLWGLWWLTRSLRGRDESSVAWPPPVFFRALAAPAALFLLLWFYAYVVADFYLYQIIVVLPLFGLFAGCLFLFCRRRGARLVLHALVLLVAMAPGVVMAVMGFKLKKTGVYEGMPPPQMQATALRRLFMDPQVYYRMEFGGDMEMIGRVNMLPPGTAILTHENRALLLHPKLHIVHLDDWEVQAAYEKPVAERLAILDSLGIKYYLYVPNEDRHVANSWLGMEELIRDGYFKKEYETPSVDGSAPSPENSLIPRGRNVLYRRTTRP